MPSRTSSSRFSSSAASSSARRADACSRRMPSVIDPKLFDPLVAEWFTNRFGSATEPQIAGWREIRTGSYYRSIQLPVMVDPDKVQARFEHGILHLTLPKAHDLRSPENRSQAAALPHHHHRCRVKTGFLVGAAIGGTGAAINVKSSRGFWIPYQALSFGGIAAFICWTDR